MTKTKRYSKTIALISFIFLLIGVGMASIEPKNFTEIGSIIAVVLIAIPAFTGLIKIKPKAAIVTILALGLFALGIETVGIYTGFPYSLFEYSMPFGYKLLGTTPWTVFVAWSPLVIGSYVLSQKYFRKKLRRYIAYLIILVGTDLVLDPGSVARGLWAYNNGGMWYGVPFENFLGWIFSGTIAYVIINQIMNLVDKEISIPQVQLSSLSLLCSLWLWAGVCLAYGLYLPGFIGIILGSLIIKASFKR